MDNFKQALIKFAHSNPSLFPNDDDTNTYSTLIQQRFSQFFTDLPTPNHPPYAAMIHQAIWELKEKGGSSEESISEYIKREYADLPWAHSTLLKHHLEKLCDRKEIRMTHKQSYLIGGADSDPPITTSRSDEKQLKRKRDLDSDSGKKSCKQSKKQKIRPDSESGKGKASNRQQKTYKKKKERQLDLQETNKQKVEVVQEKVFQEQDEVLQPLDEVDNEQENVIPSGLCEPQNLEIENGTFVQDVEEGGVPANPAEENQSEETGKDKADENVIMSTHFDDTGNENKSVELVNDKDQTEIHGKNRELKSLKKYSKRGKKHEKNDETQRETSSEPILKQHNNVTDANSHEQNQTAEDNTTNIEINHENVVGKSVDAEPQNQVDGTENGVAEEDVVEQIQTKQSPDSNPILLESKHPGKRVSTRSQIKTTSKKDASASSELMESAGYAYLPSAVFTQLTGQRAKLRSSQKNTTRQPETVPEMESQQSPQFPDLDEVETKVQDPGSSQKPDDELEDEVPKKKGRGRPRKKDRGRPQGAVSKKGQQSAEKCKVRRSNPKVKRVEGKSADFIEKVKHSHVKKGQQQKRQSQQPNEEDEPKMMRRSNRKKKDPNR